MSAIQQYFSLIIDQLTVFFIIASVYLFWSSETAGGVCTYACGLSFNSGGIFSIHTHQPDENEKFRETIRPCLVPKYLAK